MKTWEVAKTGDFYGLSTDKPDDLFAMVNKQTCQQIIQIEELPGIRFSAHLYTDDDGPSFLVDLNVFGPLEDADKVGALLTAAGVSLQRPLDGVDNVKYHNPHYLPIRHSAEADLTSESFSIVDKSAVGVDETTDQERERLDSIMNSLSHDDLLREHHTDGRIRSVLLQ